MNSVNKAQIRQHGGTLGSVPTPQNADESDSRFPFSRLAQALLLIGAVAVFASMAWQALFAGGSPDPLKPNISPLAMILSTSILVFREGLEAILVLAAVTAGMTRGKQKELVQRELVWAVPVGTFAALLATVVTWFIVVAVISEVNASELAIQAATGLLAVIVLLVVMNWFFHKIYWTGWIGHHNNRKKHLLETASTTSAKPFLGFALLGFTAVYREGFEVVLFLQNLRLRAGSTLVLQGTAIGLSLTVIVAVLTFIAHKRLPYKRMLIYTGILLGMVLLVMVGESVQEMQQAHWIPTTAVSFPIPDWMGLWFALFPNVEGLVAQGTAAFLVVGSYFSAQLVNRGSLRREPKETDFNKKSQAV